MYNHKLAVAIKTGGKVLREAKDVVSLPFGSEYSIYLKNMNTVRVKVRISIDGNDVFDGQELVINPNTSTEIGRSIKGFNLKEGNRFKFIERTAGVEAHRGSKAEDGLVRIEYQFEKVYTPLYYPYTTYTLGGDVKYNSNPYYGLPQNLNEVQCNTSRGTSLGSYGVDGNQGVEGFVGGCTSAAAAAPATESVSYYSSTRGIAPKGLLDKGRGEPWVGAGHQKMRKRASVPQPDLNEVGITVPGSISNQEFTIAQDFVVEEQKHVIVLKLIGETEKGQVIVAPITVKVKPVCTSCGRTNKATNKFCSDCGTGLLLV